MFVVLVAAAIFLASCTDGSGDPASSSSEDGSDGTAPTVDLDIDDLNTVEVIGARFSYDTFVDTGVATRLSVVDVDPRDRWDRAAGKGFDRADRDVPLAFALRSCRRVGSEVFYEVQWRPPADLTLPVTVTVYLGDIKLTSDVDGTWGTFFEVELAHPGVFVLKSTSPEWIRGSAEFVRSPSVGNNPPCAMRVVSEVRVEDGSEPDLRFSSGLGEPEVEAVDGSLQELAGGDNSLARHLQTLLVEAGPDTDLFPDYWWLAPEGDLSSVELRRDRSCHTLSTEWTNPLVTVRQERNCASRNPGAVLADQRAIEIVDPNWRVVVTGDPGEVDRFVAAAVAVPVAAVDPVGPLDGGGVVVDDFEAELVDRGLTILARVPWGDTATIFVASETPQFDSRSFEVFAVDEITGSIGGGGSGNTPGCVSKRTSANEETGFSLVLFDDPDIARIQVKNDAGVWRAVEFVEGDGVTVGLLADDLRQTSPISATAPQIRGFDTDGNRLDCVR
jgi:hypothetical protein